MNINITIHYRSTSDSRLLQSGYFPVNSLEFKKDPNKEAARVAYEWWKLIKRDMSFQVIIDKVTYNEEHNITELVKQLDDAPIPDIDLPF